MNLPLDPTQLTPIVASLEAERTLIGALLLDNSLIDKINDKLKPEHFSNQVLRELFSEITLQIAKTGSCDVVTVASAVTCADLAQLNQLAQYVPGNASLKRYANIIIERHQSRKLASISSELGELVHTHHLSIEDRVQTAQGMLAGLIDDKPSDDWVTAFDGLVQHSKVLEDRESGKVKAWETGLTDLDRLLEGGLRPGELVVIGARPSMGKTALGMTIGLNIAASHAVAMLSMEMTHSDVRDRMVAMIGNVSLSHCKQPKTGLEWDRVSESIERSLNLKFSVSDQSGLNINQVRSKARNIKRRNGLDVLIVDYIGLMSGVDQRQIRVYQIEEISRGLKNLAKELNIAVVCLAQLNRGIETRGSDSLPQLSDLRDSGAIEQDADVVMFIHRPIQANQELGEEWKHFAKLSIAKNRSGQCGIVNLNYQGNKTMFYGWSGKIPQNISKTKRNEL
jgi:replicative DNA helicase